MDAMTEHEPNVFNIVTTIMLDAWSYPIDRAILIDARRSLDVIEPSNRYTTDV